MTYDEVVIIYDRCLSQCPNIERKGKTMPYTSDHGHMFSLINKEGELGIRLPKEKQKEYQYRFGVNEFRSNGSVVKDYIKVTQDLLKNENWLIQTLKEGHQFVLTLKPK